jgi:hypothetical protein
LDHLLSKEQPGSNAWAMVKTENSSKMHEHGRVVSLPDREYGPQHISRITAGIDL